MYNVPIQAYIASQEDNTYYPDAIELFQIANFKGIKLTEATYFMLISKSISVGDENTCQSVLSEMTKQGIQPPDAKDVS